MIGRFYIHTSMHDKFPSDDSVFDRLVDGELAADERRELLASLDEVPEGWRRCALSFLEAQCLRESFGQLVHDAAATTDMVATTGSPRRTPIRRTMDRGLAWLAIAASLLVAFTLGTITRNGGAPIAGNQTVSTEPQIAEVVPPPHSLPSDASTAHDALTLFVRDDTGQTRPLRVPLVDAGTLGKQLGLQFQSGVPADVRAQLQNRGFDIRSKQSFAPLWLENGRPMLVPVEDTKIVPVSRNVY
jgi:hypothetical protein